MNQQQARKIMKRFDRRLVDDTPLCNGVSIRFENGKWRMRVFVKKKKSCHRILEKMVVGQRARAKTAAPIGDDELEVEVVRVGEIVAIKSRTDNWRPAKGGVSIGHYAITAGTLACVVYDASGNKKILSNNHVLAASNEGNPGDDIYQPGPYDGGTISDKIGILHSYVTLVFNNRSSPNAVDAALCTPTDPADVVEQIIGIAYPEDANNPQVGDVVHKSGRTSGYNISYVVEFSGLLAVNYGAPGIAWFDDQIITPNMSEPGDSGSLLVNYETGDACGLLFAGSSWLTVFNKISEVFDGLSVSLRKYIDADGPLTVEISCSCDAQVSSGVSAPASCSVDIDVACDCTVGTFTTAPASLTIEVDVNADAPWAQDPILFDSSESVAIDIFATDHGFSEYGPNETRGRFRVAEDALELYELYKGVGALPDFDSAPWETFASLPHATGKLCTNFLLYPCVARWKLNENAADTDVEDTSENSHDGVSARNTNLVHVASGNPPNLDGAFGLNGSSDIVRVPDDPVWDFTGKNFAFFFWFKKGTNNAGFVINHRGGGNVSGWQIWYADNALRALIQQGSAKKAVYKTGYRDDVWHSCYVGIEREAIMVMVIDDGTPTFSSPFTGLTDLSNDQDLSIGAKLIGDATSYFWDGSLDCIMVFDRPLTSAERTFLHNSGNGREQLADDAATYNLTLRKRNAYDLVSQNTKERTVHLDEDGREIPPNPDAPVNITFTPAAGGKGRLKAQYFYDLADDYSATKWLIYFTDDGVDPNPASDTPTEVTMKKNNGVAFLDWLSPAADHNDTLKVLVRTRYVGASNYDSTNTDVHSCTASTAGPATPEGRSFVGSEAEVM